MTQRREFEDSDSRFARALLRHGMRNAASWGDTSFRGLSQTEVAAEIHVSRPTVSGHVTRARRLLSKGGSSLALNPDACGCVIGIDIGEAHDRVVLADIHGRIYHPDDNFEPGDYEREGSDEPPPVHLRWAAECIEDLLARAELDPSKIWAVGVSLPGPVNKRTKRLQTVPATLNQSWNVVDIELPERLHLPKPSVESDYNASALTEHLWGAMRDQRHALYVKVGQRCGCSLLINHRIYRGSDGVAGRLGKTYLPRYADAGNPWIDVGNVFSLAGLGARGYRGRTAEQLVEDAHDNEQLDELLREGARGLGIAIAPLIDAFNPESVVIGGALGRAAFAWVAKELLDGIGSLGQSAARTAISERLTASAFSRETAIRGAIASALLANAPARIAKAMD
ncbi:MAG TPA: ROK family protein [Solirubrobacteraceae bacterium]|jgi:predicted NBD/HSP70 family sugar kinase|nr:ROK family protein [Solirubrobacteraceae bacterium]